MKHIDDEWEKVVRKEPFAASPFTEEHKQNVLRQVAWLKSGSEQKMSDAHDESNGRHVRSNQRRHRLRSRRAVMACTAVAAVAAGFILWNGQIVEPVIENVYPTAALQYTDDAGMSLLTPKMKKNVAVTMRDYLGKQLLITKVQDLPVSGRVSVEAGKEGDAEYALIWLDAATGNLREVQMRREMAANELEHRYLRQIPSLLEGIKSDPTLKPISARRYVKMKQGQEKPVWFTTVFLENSRGSGSIEWTRDEAVSVSGSVSSDTVSQESITEARMSIEALSGEPAPDLKDITFEQNGKTLEDTTDLYFGDRYLVSIIGGIFSNGYTVMDFQRGTPDLETREEYELYFEKLLNMKESVIRQKAAPVIKQMFNIDLDKYKLERDPNTPGMVTFRSAETEVYSTFKVRYEDDARITMITLNVL
ncbi:hypothetical protein ACFTRD_25975 [Paenibacillus sp. NPDC056933]|uniref:hypothetical protein n=1 Tax=Paenibacillus sp. NPDC056933 TaxID=3345968 RepID=UPI0036385805